MPLTTDPVFPIPTVSVEPWPDPVIDELGHDPRSAYVERFWLPVLGPSTVWFLRRLADQLDRQPEGFELDLVDTARCLGVGMRGGRNSPMLKTIERSCRFGAARMHGTTSIAVRRRLAPLTRAQVERLPEPLQREHTIWLTRPRSTPTVEQMKERARSLALSMLELGEDTDGDRASAPPLALPPRRRPRGDALGARRQGPRRRRARRRRAGQLDGRHPAAPPVDRHRLPGPCARAGPTLDQAG